MKIYQCKYYYFDNDDPMGCGGKWEKCWSPIMHRGNCICTSEGIRNYYAQKYCCGYKRGKLLGEEEITERDRAEGRFVKEKSKQHLLSLTRDWQ